MTRIRPRRTRRSEDEQGVTLVELLITIVILSMIMGAVAASFVTAFKSTAPTSELIRQSNDAQLIAGFLVRDAQSAGGTDPETGTKDPSIGVSKSNPVGSPAACQPSGSQTLVLRFSWIDRIAGAASVAHVASYYHDSSAKEIVRKTCTDTGTPSSVTLGREIEVASASCSPGGAACSENLPDLVTMHLESVKPADSDAFVYDLTASVRPEGQDAPTDLNSSNFPLITFGGGSTPGCNFSTSGVGSNGNPDVTIYGPVLINTTNGHNCDAWNFNGNSYYWSSGPVSILNGGTCASCPPGVFSNFTTAFSDPFANTYGPLGDDECNGGPNPGLTGGKYQVPAGQPTLVFPRKLNVPGSGARFGSGTFVFCQGIDSNNATITTDAGATFYIVPTGNWDWTIGNGNSVINGFVYAPNSVIDISGNGSLHATAVVASSFTTHGNPQIFLGTPFANNITIVGPRTLQLPQWTVGRAYPSTTITATGGGSPPGYKWSASGLPTGLSINQDTGVISGTPQVAGSANGMITVVDSLGDVTIKPYTININAAPAITGPATLRDWTINRDYPGTAMIATGGTTPYAWSATGLPPGLSINAATGVVSSTTGTGPTATGTFTPTIKLTDATGATATRDYTITINSLPSITGPGSLPTDVTAGAAYPSTTMTATNGTTPYSWSASGLPAGITIGAASGTISGTPTTAGTYNITVTLRDAAGATDTRGYSVTIKPGPGIATAALPIGEINRPYNFTLTPTSGGTPPYTWTATGLPAGLLMSSGGTISGIPTVSGTFNVTVTITDANNLTASKTYSLVIASAPTINGPPSLRNWTINRDYPGTQVTATGGVSPFTWSAVGLPDGLSMDSSGLITGTPTTVGTTTATITVLDSLGGTGTRNYTLTINPTPAINEDSIPGGENTVPYSTTLTANSGTLSYTWAASGLPAGLSMNVASGVLSGTPTVAGSFDITFTVTDAAGASKSKILTLTLLPAPAVDANTLPNWTVNLAYPDTTLTASGGQAPYTWSATGLPTGLTIGPSTGTVSGTPTVANTYSVTVTATDSLGGTATQTYTVKINPAPTITTGSIPSWTVNQPYTSFTMSSAGGTQPVSWTATGLPTGLTMDAAGVITGTPTDLGTFTPTVTVTDSLGATASRSYTVNINSAPSITTTTLPDGEQNVAYSATVAGTSGTTPYSWTATGLPGGVTISTGGVITGTPTATGTFTVILSLTDNAGVSAPNQSVTLTVYPQLLITGPAGASLPTWTVGRPYQATTITATGGTGVYSWNATGLPPGMFISSGGVISGTPTASGNFTVNVTVTDSASPSASKSRSYTLRINGAPSITTPSPCDVKKGKAFTITLTATGGTGPFTWTSPGFPTWGTTVSSAGVVTGTAPNTNSGSATFNVTITDSTGASATIPLTLSIGSGNTC
jgi:prepilin-type N-terminal cleavage/methylation domain-containing protein